MTLSSEAPRRMYSMRRIDIGIDLLVFLAGLVLYTWTLAPGLQPADAGEYQLTGAVLGIAHPPGYALYTIVSWLTTKAVFWLTPAQAITALSAARRRGADRPTVAGTGHEGGRAPSQIFAGCRTTGCRLIR